jgi:zinc protease
MKKTISIYFLLPAVLFALNSTAQVTKPKSTQTQKTATAKTNTSFKSEPLPIDKEVLIGKLPNGLTYYIRVNKEPQNRAELYLVNKSGSLFENDDQLGLAHFVEHMAFNGTRDFPKNELVSYLQKSGVKFGADLNAYTSFDETVYQLPLPTDSVALFEKGFDILSNWAGFVSFDDDEIDKERGVILEEARLRGKNAQERMQNQTLPVMLNNSRYAQRLPIGKEEVLKNFKYETIKQYYKDWYRPDLQAVIAVGDFDPKRVEQLIRQNFSELKNPEVKRPRVEYEIPVHQQTLVKIVTDKEYPYTLAQIMVKKPGRTIKSTADLLNNIRITLFNSMINSRIAELSQKADPPFLFGQSSFGGFLANLDAFTSVAVAKSGELEKAIKAVVAENERAKQFGFTKSEFDRAKEAVLMNMETQWKERDKTKSANFVGEYQRHFLKGEGIPGIDYEYNFVKNNLGIIKLEEINNLTSQFISDQNRVVILQAPEKDKAALPDEKTILKWINEAGIGVEAYVDNVSNEPLLEKVPAGGKILSTRQHTALGITEFKLANGVKVVLKPTDFKNDQILINGFSFGGTSLVPDADYISASFASSVIGSSGIGKFTQIQLDKMLTGKNVSVSPYISESTEGISGGAAPKDFETALQLIYLYFTEPRKDADIWASTLTQTKSVLENRGLVPASVFQDSVAAFLSNFNTRRMTPTIDQLNAASLDKAYDFYKDRFADASDFTFTIVGNIDPEAIKPLLEKYLGSLPASERVENFKDLGIKPPGGKHTKTVYKGIEEKSSVQLLFSGEYDFNEKNNLQMDALQEILNIKLIERLREKESGVYSPGVRVSYSKIPTGRYSATVYFGCAPENVERLINATLEEIANIRQNGAEIGDIQKFVAEETRSTEVQLKDNGFWLGYLTSVAQNQENPESVLNYINSLKQVTVESTKATASKYLKDDNLIRLILLPEKK